MPPRISPKKGGCSWTSLDQIRVREIIDRPFANLGIITIGASNGNYIVALSLIEIVASPPTVTGEECFPFGQSPINSSSVID
jgi:hypothetical protein